MFDSCELPTPDSSSFIRSWAENNPLKQEDLDDAFAFHFIPFIHDIGAKIKQNSGENSVLTSKTQFNNRKKKKVDAKRTESINRERRYNTDKTDNRQHSNNMSPDNEKTSLLQTTAQSSPLLECDGTSNTARLAYESANPDASRRFHESKKNDVPEHDDDEPWHQSAGGLLQPVIFGGLDGILTSFAIVAGATGGGLSISAVLVLGFSNIFADALRWDEMRWDEMRWNESKYCKMK